MYQVLGALVVHRKHFAFSVLGRRGKKKKKRIKQEEEGKKENKNIGADIRTDAKWKTIEKLCRIQICTNSRFTLERSEKSVIILMNAILWLLDCGSVRGASKHSQGHT